jgi:hypothetical protein
MIVGGVATLLSGATHASKVAWLVAWQVTVVPPVNRFAITVFCVHVYCALTSIAAPSVKAATVARRRRRSMAYVLLLGGLEALFVCR